MVMYVIFFFKDNAFKSLDKVLQLKLKCGLSSYSGCLSVRSFLDQSPKLPNSHVKVSLGKMLSRYCHFLGFYLVYK